MFEMNYKKTDDRKWKPKFEGKLMSEVSDAVAAK